MSRPIPDYIERRGEPRTPTNSPGRIMHGPNYGLWADCTIRDMSTSGAKIELSHFHRLPARFVLVDFQSGSAIEVILKWRRGDLAGLSFERRHGLRDNADPRFASAREVWVTLYPQYSSEA
jgi:hypothetical protein